MGYTDFTKGIINMVLDRAVEIDKKPILSVIDLGAQNDHSLPDFAMPYASEWYRQKGMEYDCIDINEENKAVPINLAYDLSHRLNRGLFDLLKYGQYELVVDAGTSEHVCIDSKFNWEAIYNCWSIKYGLCKEDGYIISENPKTGNWPGHGLNYYTTEFYRELSDMSNLNILFLDMHPACHNTTDGWNIVCVMQKVGKRKFPDFETFKKFSIKTS